MLLDFGHTTRPSVESRVTIYVFNYYTVLRVVDIMTHDWNGLTATAHIIMNAVEARPRPIPGRPSPECNPNRTEEWSR